MQAGYIQSAHDLFMFTKKKGIDLVVIFVYVDDFILTGSDSTLIKEAKTTHNQYFHMKDLGDLKYFLGIEVLKSKTGILLN